MSLENSLLVLTGDKIAFAALNTKNKL